MGCSVSRWGIWNRLSEKLFNTSVVVSHNVYPVRSWAMELPIRRSSQLRRELPVRGTVALRISPHTRPPEESEVRLQIQFCPFISVLGLRYRFDAIYYAFGKGRILQRHHNKCRWSWLASSRCPDSDPIHLSNRSFRSWCETSGSGTFPDLGMKWSTA